MRILLVDDENELRQLLSAVLTSAGHAVSPACNGVQASTLMSQGEFDLLLTDIVMPEKDGLEVIREYQQRFPGSKVIAMSGGAVIFDAEHCLQLARDLGVNLVLSKPFSPKELLDAVGS